MTKPNNIPKNDPTAWDEFACVQGCIQQKKMHQEQLYKHFYASMMGLVKRYTNDNDQAVSILNNGFLRVFKKIHQFKFQGSLEGWIRRIIIHAVSDYFKSLKFKEETFNDDVNEKSKETTIIELSYDYNKLLELLHQLPPTTKIIVNLFFIDEFTHKDIASLMNISINTSKWHVAEGRKMLIKMLTQNRT